MQYRHFLHDDGRAAEILRFLLVGGGCFVFDYGLMVFLTEAAGLPAMIRGERLSLEDFARLSDAWTAMKEETAP